MNVDPVEKRLVEVASDWWWRLLVAAVAVLAEGDGVIEGGDGGVVVELAASDDFVGAGLFKADAVLFRLEKVEWNGFGIVGLK